MTPTEVTRLIRLAWSQWPKLEPASDAVIIWTAGLARYDYAEAAEAVVAAAVNAAMPPSVADVIAELDPPEATDWRAAWTHVAGLLRQGRFAHRLNAAEFPDRRTFAAAESIQGQLRSSTHEAAKWAFRDAYNATADTTPTADPQLEPPIDPTRPEVMPAAELTERIKAARIKAGAAR